MYATGKTPQEDSGFQNRPRDRDRVEQRFPGAAVFSGDGASVWEEVWRWWQAMAAQQCGGAQCH